jgi:transcriptional regulator with XRE-family HTH domain
MATEVSWRNVGRKIRHLRKEHELTIRQLATGCDLSPNAISLIERGEVAPTVATLCKIAYALGVSASSLFQEVCPNEIIFSRAGQEPLAEQALAALTACAIEPAGRPPARPAAGAAPESPTGEPFCTPEFVLCVNGQIEYQVNGQTYCLQPGDSLSFNGSVLHCWRNPGADTAIAVMVLRPESPATSDEEGV